MKEIFYVFLDIDGVLWAWPFRKKEIEAGNIKKGGKVRELDPKSMLALKVLLDSLNKRYYVTLVISSTWQTHMNDVKVAFKKHNTPKVYKIDKTNAVGSRGIAIENYLKEKSNNQNFCIIDDETSDMPQYKNSGKIIKTKGLFIDSLNLSQVQKFLNQIGVPMVQSEPNVDNEDDILQK